MALTLVKEDGTGLANANSYALQADGDAYHDRRIAAHITAWSGATDAVKESALAQATMLIDRWFDFRGYKTTTTQALQWPRDGVPDPDKDGIGTNDNFANNAVPQIVIDACCELARQLLVSDRTNEPDGRGVSELTVDVIKLKFDKADTESPIPDEVVALLSKVGRYIFAKSGSVRLVRA